MNRDLYLAILALDSYNRGYDAGVAMGSWTEIGNATTGAFDLPEGSEAESFSATAYDMTGATGFSSAETVISYRGTDNTSYDSTPSDLDDWTGGAGFQTGQAALAADFYRAVSHELGELES
ncbi:MAG: hypothetical protein U1E67_02125 [Hyphomicrobiales bacterium]